MNKKSQLIVALDVETLKEAKDLVKLLGKLVNIFKVGSQLFTACGPEIVYFLLDNGKKVFLDLKFHDIPHTVAKAVESAVGLARRKDGIFMLTLHAQGGVEMLKTAVQAAAKKAETIQVRPPLVVAVTALTHSTTLPGLTARAGRVNPEFIEELTSEPKKDNITSLVLELARAAKEAGCDGVVASAKEAVEIRKEFGKDFVIVTPGIRPKGADAGDQKRIATPQEAILAGSNFLVIGRPILKARNPTDVVKNILKEMGS